MTIVAITALLCVASLAASSAFVDDHVLPTFTPAPVVSPTSALNGYFAQLPSSLFPAGSTVSSFTHDPCNGWYWAVLEHAVGGVVQTVSLLKVTPPAPSAQSLPQGAKAQYASASLSLGGMPPMTSIPTSPFPTGTTPADRYNAVPMRLAIERIQGGPTCEYWMAATTSNTSSINLYSCNAPGSSLSLSCQLKASLVESSLRTYATSSLRASKVLGVSAIAVTSKRVVVGTSQGAYAYTKGQSTNSVMPTAFHVTDDPTALVFNVVIPTLQCVESWDRCFIVTHQNIPYPNTNNTDLVHAYDLDTFRFKHFYRVPGIVDDTPLAMPYDPVYDQVHFVDRLAINVITRDGELTRLGGWSGGVPQSGCIGGVSVPSVKFSSSSPHTHHMTFYGMDGGGAMVRVLSTDGAAPTPDDQATVALNASWQYFYGPRWMPASGNTFTDGSNNVVSMGAGVFTSGSSSFVSAVFATANGGLSFISGGVVTLASKADEATEVMKRHWRLNLTATLRLTIFGNPIDGAAPTNGTANDGLWTSIYVDAESYHYASLKKDVAAAIAAGAPQTTVDALKAEMEVVRKNAWRAFGGMQELVQVTGTPGYPARSMRQFNTATDGPIPNGWYQSPSMPGYIFLSDTSSDEIVGHLHVAPIMNALLAETEEEKAAIRSHHYSILDYIIWGNLTLIDPMTGKSTHWGHWEPASINFSPFFYDGRGVNSNAMLCYLVGGYALSNGAKTAYADVFYQLVDIHGYADNMANLKITQPSDINYSDDELTYLPYLGIIMSATMDNGSPNPLVAHMQTKFQLSILRTTQFVTKVKSPYWNYIYLRSLEVFPSSPRQLNKDRLKRDGYFTLATFATSQVEWPVDNRDRLDSIADNGPTRNGQMGVLTHTLFPYNELSFVRWNSNPFQNIVGGGYECHEPTAYTAPYWIGRYYGYFSKDA